VIFDENIFLCHIFIIGLSDISHFCGKKCMFKFQGTSDMHNHFGQKNLFKRTKGLFYKNQVVSITLLSFLPELLSFWQELIARSAPKA
jgi:hypothetical protein